MDNVAEAKDPQVKQLPPENNKDQPKAEKTTPAPTQQPPINQEMPVSFTISLQDMDELVQCVNDLVKSKWARQSIFNCMNATIVPVFAKEPKDKSTASDE